LCKTVSCGYQSISIVKMTHCPGWQSFMYCPCVSGPPSAAFTVVLAPTSVVRAMRALNILNTKSFMPVHSRMTSVTTQPGLEKLMTTLPSFDDLLVSSASSCTSYISRSLETWYLEMIQSVKKVLMAQKGTNESVWDTHLSSIRAFFSSARASKMFSSLRSGKLVLNNFRVSFALAGWKTSRGTLSRAICLWNMPSMW